MSYLVLARKYRPAAFEGVAGQAQVTRALQNAIVRGRVGHAYLFSGPRGVGKTSIARIFSKCLNCETGPTITPCLTCTNCREIAQGTSIAVREIDGASHNSVDNVRDLIDSFRTLPAPGSRYKVYIIDEVHMLSTSAFNALLKSLEEPPPNTVFILATTESHKIPETVLSRCQRHMLRALPLHLVQEELGRIAAAEGMSCEAGALRLVARLSEGSMRDAQSLLDRVSAYADGSLTEEETSTILGVVGKQGLFRLSSAIIGRDVEGALSLVQAAFAQGVEPGVLLRDFAQHWRELLLVRFGGQAAISALQLVAEEIDEMQRQTGAVSAIDLQDLVDLARTGADEALRSVHPRYALESLVVRMATREPTHDLVRLVGGALASMKASGVQPSTVAKSRPDSGRSHPIPTQGGGGRTAAAPAPQTVGPLPHVEEREPVSTEVSAPRASVRWEEFVAATAQSGSRILGEHLRRLAVSVFEPGLLEASGAEFTVASLSRGAGLEKLQQALVSYSGIASWRVSLKKNDGDKGSDSAPAASIEAVERTKRNQSRKAKEEAIRGHPSVRAIEKTFPGSTIERVDILGEAK